MTTPTITHHSGDSAFPVRMRLPSGLSFGQKRKTLANNLKSRFDSRLLSAALKKAGLQPGVRAEAVPLAKMAAVFRELTAAAAD